LKKLFKNIALAIFSLSCVYAVLVLVFVLKEPFFVEPIEVKGQELSIRNDDFGEGDFGAKRRNNRSHSGIDIESPMNAPVFASKSGWARSIDSSGGYGKLIVIYHLDGYQTRYAHLSGFNIKRSQWVNQGDVIGSIGKSGNADSSGIKPHLHFEIRRRKKVFDPLGFFAKKRRKE